MRKSSIIVIFYVYLDAAVVLLETMGIAESMGITTGTGVSSNLAEAVAAMQNITPGAGIGDTLFSLYLTVTNSVEAFISAIFAGPTMFINLGIPVPIVVFLFAPVGIVAGQDIVYLLTGRDA